MANSRIPLQDNTSKPWPWWPYWGSGCGGYTVDVLLARAEHPNEICEELLHILSRLCRGFQESATKVTSQSKTFFSGNLALVVFVAFIADEHKYRSMPLYLEHRLTEDLKALKSCS